MKTLFGVVTILIILEANLFAGICVDYPGWVSEDRNLPGMPSKKLDEYKTELQSWTKRFHIQTEQGSIDNYITKSLDIGYDISFTVNIDGNDYQLYPQSMTIIDQMRDAVFLETMQNSIRDWNQNYVSKPGSTFSEIWERAFDIYNQYKEYVEKKNFFNQNHHNPVANAFFGAGNCTYGNIFTSDGLLESFAEEQLITDLIKDFGSVVANNGVFIGDMVSNHYIGKAGLAELGISFGNNIIREYDPGLALISDSIATGAFALAQGGVAMAIGPAQIYYGALEYLADQVTSSSQGAHLLTYYYFTKNYPSQMRTVLNSEGMIENFTELINITPDDDDTIGRTLIYHNYNTYFGQNAAMQEQARTAYAIATLFILAEKLDIEKMKKNIVARIKLEEIKEHGFYLDGSNIAANLYRIALPSSIVSNPEHGVPKSIVYYLNNKDLFAVYPDAVSNSQILNGSLVRKFDIDLSIYPETKINSAIAAEVLYSDDFRMNGTVSLEFNPQVSSLQLIDKTDNHQIEMEKSNYLDLKLCGDEICKADLYFKNPAQTYWEVVSYGLNTENLVSDDGTCREYRLLLNTYNLSYKAGFGNISFYAKAAGTQGSVLTLPFIDPNDTDSDSLPDDWEKKYFGNLNQNGSGDFDSDGKTNYQEYVRHTDPTKTGTSEIIETIILEPYQDVNENWIKTYYLSGEKYANVVLKNGTLDLKGRVLTIHGNLIHSGGTLNINGGSLIVNGDYRIQTENEDGTFGSSAGYLNMTNEADHVTVNGSFVMQSVRYSDLLSAGILEIKGDFTQKRGNYTSLNFYPRGTHRVILSGTQLQRVMFEYPRSSHFNILEITNRSEQGVMFESSLSTVTLISNGIKLNPLSISAMNWELSEDAVIKGDLNLDGSVLDIRGKTLTVEGNLIQSGGTLNVNGGNLIVGRDYRIQAENGDGTFSESFGYLIMTNETDHVTVNGNFVMESYYSHQNYLLAGTLEVKGDFTQNRYYYSDNFYPTGTHRVILSGTQLQTVIFESAGIDSSHFNILEITNNLDQGVVFESSLSTVTLISNGIKLNPLSISAMNWELSEDAVIKGDLNLDGSVLDIRGKTLTVEGNLIQSGGELKVNGGNLNVCGDYRIQTGYLNMTNEADHVTVNGSFAMQNGRNHDGLLSAGTLEVKGDFTNTYYSDNFCADSTHRVILSGTQLQTVISPHFIILEITNTSQQGIEFLTNAVVIGELVGTDTPVVNSDRIVLSGNAIISNGAWHYDLSFSDWIMQQNQIKVKGDMRMQSDVDMNGGILSVEGNLIQSGGKLSVNGGKLTVNGNYRIQTGMQTEFGDEVFDYSYGILNMTNEADHVTVNGSFVMQNWYGYNSLLSAGTLEIKGNFTQESDNFYADGTHRVILSGTQLQTVTFHRTIWLRTQLQTVTFESTGTYSSHFNILEITNNSSEGVEFTTPVSVTTLFNHNQHPFTLSDPSQSSFADYDGDTHTDEVDTYPLDPSRWEDTLVYYTITINTSGNGTGTLSHSTMKVLSGASITVQATPDPSSDFAGWTGDFTGTGDAVFTDITSDKTISAVFVLRTGDLTQDKFVNLEDAVIALQIITGIRPQIPYYIENGVNSNGKIGMEEVIYILQKTSEIRQ